MQILGMELIGISASIFKSQAGGVGRKQCFNAVN